MHVQKIVSFIKQLVEISSSSHDKEGVDKVGSLVKDALSFMNVEVHHSSTNGDLLIFRTPQYSKEKPSVLLSGHSDTVFDRSAHWPVKKKGNQLFGPGVNDMKAGLAVIVYVLSELNKKQALENITFTLIPDEEIGSYTFKDILHKEYKKHDFAFVYEEGTLESTPSIKTYEPARRALVVSRKGFGAGYFKIAGPGGHSGSLSAKTLRANTILEAAHKISELEHIADYEKGTTLNAGVISGGTTFNSIPALTEFWHDYRVQTFGERVRVKKTVEQLARKVFIKGTKTDFNWLHDIPPMQVNSEREQFAHQLVDGASKIGLNIIFEHRAGGSDANQVYMANPKAIVLDGFGPQGEHEHSKNEFLYIDSIEPAVIFSLLAIEQAIHSQPTS